MSIQITTRQTAERSTAASSMTHALAAAGTAAAFGLLAALGLAATLQAGGDAPRALALLAAATVAIAAFPLAAHATARTAHTPQARRTPSPAVTAAGHAPALDDAALTAVRGVGIAPRFRSTARVFGADADMVRDARALGGGGVLGDAVVAEMALFPGRETALVARFHDADAARAARQRYLALLGVPADAPVDADAVTIRRPRRGVVRVAVGGAQAHVLLAWSAPDEAALDRRVAATGAVRAAAAA